jgi:hypothetical protein
MPLSSRAPDPLRVFLLLVVIRPLQEERRPLVSPCTMMQPLDSLPTAAARTEALILAGQQRHLRPRPVEVAR